MDWKGTDPAITWGRRADSNHCPIPALPENATKIHSPGPKNEATVTLGRRENFFTTHCPRLNLGRLIAADPIRTPPFVLFSTSLPTSLLHSPAHRATHPSLNSPSSPSPRTLPSDLLSPPSPRKTQIGRDSVGPRFYCCPCQPSLPAPLLSLPPLIPLLPQPNHGFTGQEAGRGGAGRQ